ncbi:MAG: SPFH domain-containing protein [Planctomycetes bacterium]|nr:SPFH domain-containing protein [Planctomycetota bacterium]
MQMREIERRVFNGWAMLTALLLAGALLGWLMCRACRAVEVWSIVTLSLLILVWIVLQLGYFMLQPNQAAVLTLFGKYLGTVKTAGFHWTNPLVAPVAKKVSLRAHNLNGATIKVNDHRGNPVEIAAVVVWRVTDTAQAVFDVEDYQSFVSIQSESALRHLASAYPYDTSEEHALSLRGSMDEVSAALQRELQERVSKAGVQIDEARLSHLAYAAEIAGAMLQRQQAEAVVAARTRIVDGAVGMVEMALERLESKGTIALDEERKAAMVSNLLVVLCGHAPAQAVVNAGTLYH